MDNNNNDDDNNNNNDTLPENHDTHVDGSIAAERQLDNSSNSNNINDERSVLWALRRGMGWWLVLNVVVSVTWIHSSVLWKWQSYNNDLVQLELQRQQQEQQETFYLAQTEDTLRQRQELLEQANQEQERWNTEQLMLLEQAAINAVRQQQNAMELIREQVRQHHLQELQQQRQQQRQEAKRIRQQQRRQERRQAKIDQLIQDYRLQRQEQKRQERLQRQQERLVQKKQRQDERRQEYKRQQIQTRRQQLKEQLRDLFRQQRAQVRRAQLRQAQILHQLEKRLTDGLDQLDQTVMRLEDLYDTIHNESQQIIPPIVERYSAAQNAVHNELVLVSPFVGSSSSSNNNAEYEDLAVFSHLLLLLEWKMDEDYTRSISLLIRLVEAAMNELYEKAELVTGASSNNSDQPARTSHDPVLHEKWIEMANFFKYELPVHQQEAAAAAANNNDKAPVLVEEDDDDEQDTSLLPPCEEEIALLDRMQEHVKEIEEILEHRRQRVWDHEDSSASHSPSSDYNMPFPLALSAEARTLIRAKLADTLDASLGSLPDKDLLEQLNLTEPHNEEDDVVVDEDEDYATDKAHHDKQQLCMNVPRILPWLEAGLEAILRKRDLRRELLRAISSDGIDISTIVLDADLSAHGSTSATPAATATSEWNVRRFLDTPVVYESTVLVDALVDWCAGYNRYVDQWIDSYETDEWGRLWLDQLLERVGHWSPLALLSSNKYNNIDLEVAVQQVYAILTRRLEQAGMLLPHSKFVLSN